MKRLGKGSWARRFRSAVCLGLAAAVATLFGSPATSQSRLQAGVLSCQGDGGWGVIIGSTKSFRCAFVSADRSVRGQYSGVINRFGLDLGVTGQTAISWLVFGPAEAVGGNYVEGSLAGTYVGVGADAAVGLGLGANALVGGGPGSFTLQPISIQVQTGLSIAAGVQNLSLTYQGPLS